PLSFSTGQENPSHALGCPVRHTPAWLTKWRQEAQTAHRILQGGDHSASLLWRLAGDMRRCWRALHERTQRVRPASNDVSDPMRVRARYPLEEGHQQLTSAAEKVQLCSAAPLW